MIKTLPYILFSLGLILLLPGCGKEDVMDIHLTHTLPPFTEIEILSVFDVDLIEGDDFTLEIIGRKDIAEGVTFAVEAGVLRIDHGFGNLWLSPGDNKIKLVITAKGYTRLFAKQTCFLRTLNPITTPSFTLTLGSKLNFADIELDCDLFVYYNTGPTGGQVKLRGTTEHLHIYVGSLMGVDARDVISNYTLVETGSKADVHVQAMTSLHYSITGTGDIYLWNKPAEIIPGEITSTGRLIPF